MNHKDDFHQVVLENQRWLLRYIISIVKSRETAEDILQEVFIRAFKNYDSYEEKGKIKKWLCAIARNTSLRHLGLSANQNCISLFTDIDGTEDSLQLADMLPDTAPLIEEQIVENELTKQILSAIDRLPEPQRQVVYLRYVKDFSVAEVAALTKQPAGSVKSKSYYGLEKVRKCLSNYLVKGDYIMDCRESYTFLYHYGKGLIQPDDRENLEKHLAVCKECKDIAESLRILLPQIKPAEEGEHRHYLIAIPLKDGYTLFYCGSNCFFEDHEEINKMLKDNDEAIPSDWGLFGGHDDDFEHLAELDNEGNKIEFELIPNPHLSGNVRVVYKRLKKVYPEFINTSVLMRKIKLFTPLLEDPDLMIGKIQNHYGNNVKSGLYLAIPSSGKNIRIKKGNGVIDAGPYKFAFSDRYVTEDETIKLECSYLKK